jgi:PIN domain nuclease of toxin-antitoxin system
MAVLLDTHAFLWWVADDQRLSKPAARAIAATECLLTVDRFVQEQLEVNGFRLLAISLEHLGGVAALPFRHRDPFDRLLAAQARPGLSIVSADPVFRRYGVTRVW